MQVFLTSRYLAIAMEYVAGGDMFEYVVRKGGLKESEARWFFQQLIIGVDYLHRMVYPRDSPAASVDNTTVHCACFTALALSACSAPPWGIMGLYLCSKVLWDAFLTG